MSTRAAEIMTSPAITVLPQTNLADIAKLLSTKGISAVPVCNADATLVGIVSERDVLEPFRESARLRRDWWLNLLVEGETPSEHLLDYLGQDQRTAADVMHKHVITAELGATVPELADLMVKHGVKCLPVARDGKVVGIVSRADLVRTLANAPAMPV